MTASSGRQPVPPVVELAARLRDAGCEAGPEQLADALWLARRMSAHAPGTPEPPAPAAEPEDDRPGGNRTGPAGREGDGLPGDRPEEDGPVERRSQPGPAEPPAPVSLYAPTRHGGALGVSSPVRVPAAGTLPGLLELQRALRPLQRYRSRRPGRNGPLDEERTVDLSARSAAVRPVFRPARNGGAEIQLFMDTSASASVWQLTFDCLRQTCEQLGAFRDVQALYLHRAADGTPMVGTDRGRDAGPLRPADQYRDTTGRRLTLVVSDCVGPLWQDGAAQRLLHRWSGESPLAVVQPLPPRLWSRTALPAEPGTLLRHRGAGGRIAFQPDEAAGPQPDGAAPVPVLLPTPAAMGSWARLLGGGGPGGVRGAAAWVRARHRGVPAPAAAGRAGRDPRELLGAFRASASPGALSLAVHLTAVPLLLPVIQLVQEAMLPDTGPMELAEVLLGGLLDRLPDEAAEPGPRYTFVPGVQELLMQSLDRGTAELVLKYVSEYVERRFGTGTRNFPALAAARLSGRPPAAPDGTAAVDRGQGGGVLTDELFAEVPARVVRWYAPSSHARSDRAEAERLLRDWWVQGDPGLLRQARVRAEAAVVAAGGTPDEPAAEEADAGTGELARARLVLGRVLHALTRTGDLRGRPQPAAELLRAAERQLVARDPRTRFELVAVRHRLWQVEGDTAHLYAAQRVLRELEEERDGTTDGQDAVEGGRRLWLGRTLLALARADEDRHPTDLRRPVTARRRNRRAEQAAVELEVACRLLTAAENGPGALDGQDEDGGLCAVLLDLCAALRHAGADTATRRAAVERAEAVAGDDRALRMRAARARARMHRDAEDWEAADAAYGTAERSASRDGPDRCALLAEWGTMRMAGPWHPDRAEGVLREALTCVTADGPLAARVPLLLGQALTRRYLRERFLPDLFEATQLLEQAARRSEEHLARAGAWLRLAEAEQRFPTGYARPARARGALERSLEEARRAQGERPETVAVARALHALGMFLEGQGDRDGALSAYRSAGEEWGRLAARLPDVPWPEVAETRDRIGELESG